MAKKRLVMALGHDALGTNLPEQKAAVAKTAKLIADFIQDSWQVAIVHSNAPQVGMIHAAMNEFGKVHEGYTPAPMSVCSAMSQGYIGYDLQNGIRTELIKRGIYKPVSTILTQVTVDPYDESSYIPVKKIGRFMSAQEAKEEEEKGNYVTEVPGKGFCRIVAAPKPVAIVEIDAIKALLDADQIVIACGGGGIPVMEQGSTLKGASAVIEKDLASGLLAQEVDADVLMILTDVDEVALNYGSSDERGLTELSAKDADKYMEDGQFGSDTMAPKIQAALSFLRSGKDRAAVITSQNKAKEAMAGKSGTWIRP
ncbi:MAG TPA: carbamate kinase [Candidatus Lachnoclostridium stercoravium]|uniref:Carbamate kinase n=1 Tax=Candidatus Lachnoclostridium stercoravium TaxID=2838633 RepID=A0A9D2HIE6_9FIRM|nr:carbamate kinase [Candidatus Lachnoclostridium stercoravium]